MHFDGISVPPKWLSATQKRVVGNALAHAVLAIQ